MKKIITFLSLSIVCLVMLAADQNAATLRFTVYGLKVYRIDIKTNLNDRWRPYASAAMWGNYLGTNQYGSNVYSVVTSDMHETISVNIPVSTNSGYFRVYTLTPTENSNGIVWPTATSQSVPVELIPPTH